MFKWRLRACRVQAGLYQREAASRTGGAKVGGDPYYLSEDNLQ